MKAAAPKLSICIPTYNRAPYLRKALDQLLTRPAFDFDFEVVISDNASSDDTAEVVADFASQHSAVRYVRQATTVDVEDNVVTALRLARGEYSMYLADDDMLLTRAVANVVRYLDRHRNVAVCFSPWQLYDDVAKQSLGQFYQHDKEMVFSKSTALQLCNEIVQRHIFPEIFVYRSEPLRKLLAHRSTIYWAFSNLIDVLNYGDAAFLPTPFYLSVTQHWQGESRVQEGDKHATSQWDSYRGGMEYLIYRAFRYAGFPSIPADQRQSAREMVDGFVNVRMTVALRMLVARAQYLRAYEVFARLLANGALSDADAQNYAGFLAPRAAVEAFVRTFKAMTGMARVGLYQLGDADAVKTLIGELAPEVPVDVLDEQDPTRVADTDRYLVMSGDGSHRQTLIEAGFPAGQVWSEHDLMLRYVV